MFEIEYDQSGKSNWTFKVEAEILNLLWYAGFTFFHV